MYLNAVFTKKFFLGLAASALLWTGVVCADTLEYTDEEMIEYVEQEQRWSDFLPIWGDEVKARGIELPRPFGLSVGRVGIELPLAVNKTNVTLGGTSLLTLDESAVSMGDVVGTNIALRGDVWILPFLNVYGFVGETYGNVDVTFRLPKNMIPSILDSLKITGVPAAAINALTTAAGLQQKMEISRNFEFHGVTRGLGFTLAGGYKQIFALADFNASRSRLDLLDQSAFSKVWSYRIGWNGHLYERRARAWVGWMTHDLTQTAVVDLSGLNLPLLNDIKINLDVADEVGDTPLAGFSYELSENWSLIADIRFGERKLANTLLEYRF